MAEAPTPIIDQILSNDGFWPSVPVRRWVDGYKVSTDYREELARTVLVQAMIKANKDLEKVKGISISMGFSTLQAWINAHPEQVIAGEPLSSFLYLSIVYNLAKAATMKPLAAMQRTKPGNGEDAAIAADSFEIYFLDAAQTAIASLLDIFEPDIPHATNGGVYVASIGKKHRSCW